MEELSYLPNSGNKTLRIDEKMHENCRYLADYPFICTGLNVIYAAAFAKIGTAILIVPVNCLLEQSKTTNEFDFECL